VAAAVELLMVAQDFLVVLAVVVPLGKGHLVVLEGLVISHQHLHHKEMMVELVELMQHLVSMLAVVAAVLVLQDLLVALLLVVAQEVMDQLQQFLDLVPHMQVAVVVDHFHHFQLVEQVDWVVVGLVDLMVLLHQPIQAVAVVVVQQVVVLEHLVDLA
jgi:hypothetical protein